MKEKRTFETPMYDHAEMEAYYGEVYEKSREMARVVYPKLISMLDEEQRKVFEQYTYAQMMLRMYGESYYYEKGFEAGRKASQTEGSAPSRLPGDAGGSMKDWEGGARRWVLR